MTANTLSRQRLTINDLAGRMTVTVEQAGELVGLSRGSAYQAVREGQIPSVRLGHRYFVPTTALLRDVLGLPADRVAQILGLPNESSGGGRGA